MWRDLLCTVFSGSVSSLLAPMASLSPAPVIRPGLFSWVGLLRIGGMCACMSGAATACKPRTGGVRASNKGDEMRHINSAAQAAAGGLQ